MEEFNINMQQKTVLLDLSDLKNPTCGFGQIALNYAHYFSELNLPDIRFVFLLPKGPKSDLEEKVECHPTSMFLPWMCGIL